MAQTRGHSACAWVGGRVQPDVVMPRQEDACLLAATCPLAKLGTARAHQPLRSSSCVGLCSGVSGWPGLSVALRGHSSMVPRPPDCPPLSHCGWELMWVLPYLWCGPTGQSFGQHHLAVGWGLTHSPRGPETPLYVLPHGPLPRGTAGDYEVTPGSPLPSSWHVPPGRAGTYSRTPPG